MSSSQLQKSPRKWFSNSSGTCCIVLCGKSHPSGRANTNSKNHCKKKKKSMKHSSLGGESCVDGKIEELSSTAWVSGSPSVAAAVSLRDSVSVCDVLICHLLKYNGEQMNCRWVANTHPHTRTHAKRHREICSIHRTGSHYITVDSVTVEHW